MSQRSFNDLLRYEYIIQDRSSFATFQSIGKFHGFPRRPVDAKRRGNLNSTRSSLEVMTVMDFAILALCQPMMSFVISSSSRDSPANISESNSQEHSINASKDGNNKTNNF